MIGDIVIGIKTFFKQQFCCHDYDEHIAKTFPPIFYRSCKKCGRVK